MGASDFGGTSVREEIIARWDVSSTETFEDGIRIRPVDACIHLDDPGQLDIDDLVPRRRGLEPESATNE